MIFEYFPRSLPLDLENLTWICSRFRVESVLVPANPVSRPHPDSIASACLLSSNMRYGFFGDRGVSDCARFIDGIEGQGSKCGGGIDASEAAGVQKQMDSTPSSRLILGRPPEFIPTIKTSNYTEESLTSALLSLKYSSLPSVAIITGDEVQPIDPIKLKMGHLDVSPPVVSIPRITTIDALTLLSNMAKEDDYFSSLKVFCAIDSLLSRRALESLRLKLSLGVRNFITQPFYAIGSLEKSQELPCDKEFPSFKNFLKGVESYIASLPLGIRFKDINFYCGFLPLFREKSANHLLSKPLGIVIPKSYIQAIESNAIAANKILFNELKAHKYSLSYLHFEDVKSFLESVLEDGSNDY